MPTGVDYGAFVRDNSTALITAGTTVIVALLGKFFGLFSYIAKHIDIALERQRERADSRPPKKTILLADNETVLGSYFWQIANYDPAGPATGFKCFLFVTRLHTERIVITAITVRLPLLLRRKHHVVKTLIDPSDGAEGGGLSATVIFRSVAEVGVNFYVQPPIEGKDRVKATIRLRDQFSHWHQKKVTFRTQKA